jgi:hypothetical protein
MLPSAEQPLAHDLWASFLSADTLIRLFFRRGYFGIVVIKKKK